MHAVKCIWCCVGLLTCMRGKYKKFHIRNALIVSWERRSVERILQTSTPISLKRLLFRSVECCNYSSQWACWQMAALSNQAQVIYTFFGAKAIVYPTCNLKLINPWANVFVHSHLIKYLTRLHLEIRKHWRHRWKC